ncbi:hypothetical protein [Spirosoma arcticum]
MAKKTAVQIIHEAMPGMEIVKKKPEVVADSFQAIPRSADSMTTLRRKYTGSAVESLKEKYLGVDSTKKSALSTDSTTPASTTQAFTVRPKKTVGNNLPGDERTVLVDIVKGEIKLISG